MDEGKGWKSISAGRSGVPTTSQQEGELSVDMGDRRA